MLRDNFLRVQCKLVIAMTDKLLDWAYHWINAEGARVLKDEAGQKRLPPGMRLPEVPDFSLEFLRRLTELKDNHGEHLADLQTFAREVLDAQEVSMRMHYYFYENDFYVMIVEKR